MANSTITLVQSLEWCKRFVFNRELSIGNFKEPLMTSANLIYQTTLGPPFAWRWNRVVTGFVCTPGQQDYTLGNWAASTAESLGFLTVDTNGNSQEVTVAGTTGVSEPSWNATTGGTTTDGGVTWTNLGPIPEASTNFTFGWIETASVQDTTSSKWYEMSPKISLGLDSATSRPLNISAQIDTGNGNITFRLMPVPDKAYPIAITLQEKAALLTSLNQTWAPIPDEFSYIYQVGLLSYMYEFCDDQRSSAKRQQFVTHLLAANDGLDETARNIFLNNYFSLSLDQAYRSANLNQGLQGKAGL
jgi:hypothetical protein